MNNGYINQKCPVCGEEFTRESDIVVCPVCGTPHHRQCYLDNGGCANSEKHNDGYVWEPENIAIPAGKKQCPYCGAIVGSGDSFCLNCGKDLKGTNAGTAPVSSPDELQPGLSFEEFKQARRGQAENTFVVEEIDGVPVSDIANYMEYKDAATFIPKFHRLTYDKKYFPFSFLAFAFPPIWFAYRSIWGYAILSFLINGILNTPSYLTIMYENGQLALSAAQTSMLSGFTIAFGIIQIIMSLIWGFFAIRIYKKKVLDTLNNFKVQSQGNESAYHTMIYVNRGPSKAGKFIVYLYIGLLIISLLF